MNRRSNRYAFFVAAVACVFLLAGGCDDSSGLIDKDDVRHVPALNDQTFDPLSNESGSIPAYVGTEVSVSGFNLDQVGTITMDGIDVEFTYQDIKQIRFRIPFLDYAQRDQPYAVELKAFDREGQVFYTGNYFVTVPVTDALVSEYAPVEGTVGTQITLTGRNLNQITRIHFGETVIESSSFVEVAGETLTFAVPVGDYTEADTEVAISAEWGEHTIDVTGETLFTLHIALLDPVSPQPEGVNSALGDEISLTGQHLDLIDAVKWGEFPLTILEKTAETLKVRFPASIEPMEPAVQTAALTAEYGVPAQVVTLAGAWRLDTTPSVTVLVPEATSLTAEDGGADNKFYLGKTVTVSGVNLTGVEGIEIRYNDGEDRRIAATVLDGTSDGQLQFTVPEGVTFAEATEVSVAALYNGGEVADFGTAMVYPFYYYPNVTIGAQDETNRDKAFFVPDLGRVLSTDEFATFADGSMLDPYISSSTQSKANNLNKEVIETAEKYYSVLPYFFCTNSSENVLSIISPSNSPTQIRNHRTSDNEQLPSGYGTPVIGFRNIEYTETSSGPVTPSSAELATVEKAHAGTLSAVSDLFPKLVSSGAPQFDNLGALNNRFKVGQVLLVQYMSYEAGSFSSLDDVCRGGLFIVKSITEVTEATASKKSTITFDFYWSKPLNE